MQCLFTQRIMSADPRENPIGAKLSCAKFGGRNMRHLLNTLFVTTEDAYLTLDGENVVVRHGEAEMARFPLHAIEHIIAFS
ncbi:MAG: CRISPR-associated endonuclease Cas1, partial [Ruthenibacterium sp.]